MVRGKRDRSELEARRARAAALFSEGVSQAEVARKLGVSRTTTMLWHRAWKAQGRRGLALAEDWGRPRKVDAAALSKIQAELVKGPQAHGWSTEIWTLPRIAEVIERVTGVRYHEGHVWKLLHGMGWSLQRPTTRARERDEAKIEQWKRRTWLRVKKTPDRAGRSFSPTKAAFPKDR
jgi:transposase